MGELVRYFLWLGTTGFGGPIALVGFMQRDLVERRRWFSAEVYRDGLALAQLAPGPLAAQLAMYLGWARGGAWGAALVGVAFVLPSFVMVLGLAIAYIRFGGLPWMEGAFYGIGAAVVAIIARTEGGVRISWNAAAGRTYCVQAKSDLATPWSGSANLACVIATNAVPFRRPRSTNSRPPSEKPQTSFVPSEPPTLESGRYARRWTRSQGNSPAFPSTQRTSKAGL
jgi:chromate transporter